MLKPLTLKTKLLRSIALAPAFLMPMVWFLTFGRDPDLQMLPKAWLFAAAISFVSAYCVTMFVEAWHIDEKT